MRITQEETYEVRYFTKEDVKWLQRWLCMPEMTPYFPCTTKQEVDQFINVWQAYARYHCVLTATYKKAPVGIGAIYLMPYRKVAHHALLYVIIDPSMQGKGIGTSLVRNMGHLAKNYFHLERIDCELYEGSKLVSILKKEGYRQAFEQKDFVEGHRSRTMMEKRL